MKFEKLAQLISEEKSNTANTTSSPSNRRKERSVVEESFDDYYDSIISEMSYDEDDYKCDLIELLEKCTGPTKKASSDRKGKKWMKCARQPDGSYKKIHWGQAGVRVSGKSNTKRRKSFRSRHNCSSAKPGTPRYQACKDW